LRIDKGRQLAVLGDCVLGARVAESLALKPGDSLVSSPETLFDLAGVYPLKMKVVGVLEKSHTSDDLAVFVDLKTAWVIQGLGHGHEDVTKLRDATLVLKRTEKNVAATAKLYHHTEITEKNIDAFHFHGDLSQYPLTAVLAVPRVGILSKRKPGKSSGRRMSSTAFCKTFFGSRMYWMRSFQWLRSQRS
jgi:putative ABC transport system permease protein